MPFAMLTILKTIIAWISIRFHKISLAFWASLAREGLLIEHHKPLWDIGPHQRFLQTKIAIWCISDNAIVRSKQN